MTNLLVTGGAGYIGSHTCNALREAGYRVVIIDNLSSGYAEAIPVGCIFVEGDIRDTQLVKQTLAANQISGVVHFAAKISVPESVAHPLDYYDNNTTGVMHLLQACKEAKVKYFVFSSTAAVYGERQDGLIHEDSTVEPVNPYGASKYFSERIIKDVEKEFGLRSAILRYFNVAGASLKGNNGQRNSSATHLIKMASHAALGKIPALNVFGTDYLTADGTAIRDYIHIEDLAELHIKAIKYLEGGGATDVFNCGYGRGYSVKEVINSMKKVSGTDFKVTETGRRPGDSAYSVADVSKVKKVFHWTPRHANLDMICKSALDWEKKLK
ncbi:MAG: UDP-glucose 4-epimerase GalE [Bdellovibrionota bacterium]